MHLTPDLNHILGSRIGVEAMEFHARVVQSKPRQGDTINKDTAEGSATSEQAYMHTIEFIQRPPIYCLFILQTAVANS